MFAPMQTAGSPPRKSVYVAQRLLEALQRGDYSPGDRLPTEEELAQEVGVSRTAVREALAALRLAGIVASRAGAGTFVQYIPTGEFGARAVAILREQASPSEMIQARRAMEEGVTKLAARRAEPQDLDRLDAIVEEMRQAAQRRDYRTYLRLNKEFHMAIAQATHNRAISNTMEDLLRYMDEPLWQQFRQDYYDAEPGRLHRAVEIHARIADAIRHKDLRAIGRLLRLHFQELGQMEDERMGAGTEPAGNSVSRRQPH